MIKVSVMYPHQEGSKFDVDYYLNHHLSMVREKWGALGMQDVYVTRGLAGGAPDAPPAYQIMAHITFDSMAALEKALGSHGKELMEDVPNFTDVTPVVQISEVLA